MARRITSRLRSPWPLRTRLTVAVASVTAVVLAVTGVLVFGQFSRALDGRTDAELVERADGVAALARQVSPERLLEVSGEGLAQRFAPGGELRGTTRALGREPLLAPAQVRAADRRARLLTVAAVRGTDDGARVRAFAIRGGGVVAIAEARDRREQELGRLATLLAIGLPGALLLAAFTGHQVAGAALRPVELIRSRAERLGESDPAGRLPQPGTGDELDRLTRTLNDLLGRLGRALENERRIVGDASHELRTPISVLRTRLDVAARGGLGEVALRAVLEEARGDVARLAHLADDLLLLARADQGRLPLRPQPLDVQDLLEQTAGRHAAAAATAGRPLRVDVEIAGGAVVLADPDRLAQALDNLVVTALRHGAGTIELVARVQEAAMVELTVADRGPGFADELLPRAFERFAQGAGAQGDGGAGLGLAIVATLAAALGGRVGAVNRAGGGAEVTIAVPAA